MAEYIEREALLNKLQERDLCLCVTERDIKEAPAADVEPVVRCKDCGKSREWGNEGTLLCYRDKTTIHVVKPNAYCDGSQRRFAEDAPEVLKFEPVVRCEHCIHSLSDGWICGGTGFTMPSHPTYPNAFCSFGERRAEDA